MDPLLELRVFPLDGTLLGSDNSAVLSNILILKKTCDTCNPTAVASDGGDGDS